MEESGHHDAGVRRPIDTFVLGQARDAFCDKPVICPADKIHHGFQISGGRNSVKQPDRWKS
jgi:hypothetical protein